LIPLLADREARVRYFAAEALGKLKHKPAVKPLMQVLRENADQDPFLRHAAVTALIRIEDKPSVLGFARDTSTAVRLGVVLCLRGWQDGAIADFLSDADLFVRVEAARAIHDLPLEPVFPKLADQLRTLYADGPLAEADALARRALNAAFRLGTPAWAEQIGALALRTNTPAHIRAEALACLRDWAKPSPRDRVNGFWRPLPERDTATARAVVSKIYPELLRTTVGTLQRDVIQLMTDLKISVDRAALEKQARDSNQDPELRAALLRLLATGEGKLSSETMTVALKDTAPVVRSTARDLLAKIDPQAAVAELSHAFTAPESTVHDQQQALQTLQRLNTPEAGKLLDSIADKLANGTLPASITLDAWEAIKAVPTASRDALRRKFEAKMPADPVGRFQVSLEGGDRQRGKEIFFNHTAAQCVRCHKAEKTGGIAGPDLSEIARRVPEKTRQYLLESLLVPSAKIAQGYANVTLTLTDGRILAGTILSETAAQVILQTPDGKKLTVPQEDIETRTVPTSPMPSVEKTLTAREIRDLVEYLSTLR
jgi:putative heme-binding domain-containing protein